MTPSDQPVVKPTHQQLQQQVQQRITTMSRVDPTHPTAFDSFSTIVQDLPAGRICVSAPWRVPAD